MPMRALILAIGLVFATLVTPDRAAQAGEVATVHYRTVAVDGVRVFYREAGRPDAPTIVLLHGFPTSSAMYRGLIPKLAAHFHVLAPDYPGYGHSDAPPPARYAYTFDHLAQTMRGFLDRLGVKRTILYMQDFGGPVGFRLALAQPERIAGIVVQNANAYREGFAPDLFKSMTPYWMQRTPQTEQAQRFAFSAAGIRWQYITGAHDPAALDPDAWALDAAQMARPGEDAIQLDLLYDYRTNPAQYPAWQAWLRQHQPKTLILWGKGDPLFTVQGAYALKRDVPGARLVIYDAGHFMLQEHADEAAREIIATFAPAGGRAPHRRD